MRFSRFLPSAALLAAGLVGTTLGLVAAPAVAQTTVTFRFHDTEGPQMRLALDQFEKANPDIKVTMQRVSWGDGRQQYLREAAVGQAPDVVEIVYVWARPFADAGALRPLDDFIAKGGLGLKGWSDFIATDLAKGKDGKTYAIPYATDTLAIMVNKDLLKAAGVPHVPTTWAEMRDASRAVFKKTGKTGFGFAAGTCGTPSSWFYLNSYWWSKGWALIEDAGGGKYKMGITPAQIAEGLAYYKSFLDEGDNPKAMMSACLLGAPEVVEGMVKGDIAMVSVPDFTALRIISTFRERNPGKPLPFATAPHPADVAGSKMHFGGRMLGMSPNVKNPEAAWKLIQFLTQPDPTFTKFLTNYTPSQHAAVAARKYPEGMEGFGEQMKTARSWGAYATGPVAIPFMWNATGRAAGAVFIGEKTPAQAGAELHAQIEAELAKNQK